jgi:hypothetical protein
VVRRSRNQITKELAIKIVGKLQAVNESESGDEHDTYVVYHEQRIVSSFGIRRSSRKNKGHDHIPKELGVGPSFAKLLGQCPKSKTDYLVRIGELEEPADAE